MKKKILLICILFALCKPLAAQQNWAAIPCSKVRDIDDINDMLVDSLHNELILYSVSGYSICNSSYKGIFAYNGSSFRDLDKGINTHNSNLTTGGVLVSGCIPYNNRTLFGGGFYSVGSNTLFTKSIASWNGSVWDTFPTRCFNNIPNNSSGGGLRGFLNHNGKLWMYGSFDTIGSTISKNIVAYDGNTFIPVPAIPVNNPSTITEMIVYKNKLIAVGNFYDYPSFNFYRLAQFDGSNWSQVGGGVRGGLSACQDMSVYRDTLYITGSFSKSDGNAGNYIMKWDGNQLIDANFGDFCGYGAIWRLVPFKNRLYAFGDFQCAAHQRAFGMAYYENGSWTVSQDSVDNVITSAVLYNHAIYIGGGFKSINGDTSIQKFAKLVCPDFDASNGCLSGVRKSTLNSFSIKLFPNPLSNKITIEFDNNNFLNSNLQITNTLGQIVFTKNKLSQKQEIDLSFLVSGVYYLKIECDEGWKIFKLIKE